MSVKELPAKAEVFYLKVSLISFIHGNFHGAGVPAAMVADKTQHVRETENSGNKEVSSSSAGMLELESSDNEVRLSGNRVVGELWDDDTASFSKDLEKSFFYVTKEI